MRHSPQDYAKAFARACAQAAEQRGLDADTRGSELVKSFARLILKNGDAHMAPKILAATARALRATTGARHVTVTSARPLPRPARTAFAKLLTAHDTVEEKVDPSLLAGVKVAVNDELQFDGTLKRKLDKLFGAIPNS